MADTTSLAQADRVMVNPSPKRWMVKSATLGVTEYLPGPHSLSDNGKSRKTCECLIVDRVFGRLQRCVFYPLGEAEIFVPSGAFCRHRFTISSSGAGRTRLVDWCGVQIIQGHITNIKGWTLLSALHAEKECSKVSRCDSRQIRLVR